MRFALDVHALRAIAGDDQPEPRVSVRHRADDEIDTLDGLDSTDRQDVIAVRSRGQPRCQKRRMIQRRGMQAVVLLESRGGRAGDGVQRAALAQHFRVQRHEPVAQTDVLFRVREVAVRGPAQLVSGAVLVHEPRDLAWMSHAVGRELGRDDEVDWTSVAFTEVQEPPRRRMGQDFFLRIPLERNAHQLREMAVRAKLAHQLADENLRATVHEGHLGFADEDRLHDACDSTWRGGN